MSGNRWLQKIADDPGHSEWYIERFRRMQSQGADLAGEARFVDALAPRHAHVLDAGCGPGRVGGRLHELGHRVVGVDIDPALIDAARRDHPGPTWIVADLATLDFTAADVADSFDVIVCAGNVMTFLDPATRQAVLASFGRHLDVGGRAVVGFGAGREYAFDDFFSDVAAVGLRTETKLSTWDLRSFEPASTFLVAVLSH